MTDWKLSLRHNVINIVAVNFNGGNEWCALTEQSLTSVSF